MDTIEMIKIKIAEIQHNHQYLLQTYTPIEIFTMIAELECKLKDLENKQ